MLDGRKRLLSELLHVWIVAIRPVFFKEIDCLLMSINLLLGIGFVKTLRGCAVKIVNQFLVLGVQRRWKVNLDVLDLYDPVSSSVVLL